ncbi:MAG: hypothetical protein E7471_02220 [Ruminococcaceae bacterium]|nr:hypothetical protein [Oscillospiraceae bacterium]
MKSYLKWSLSLFFDHIIALIGSVLVIGFLGAWSHWVVSSICAVICIALACFLPYHDSWKVGASDHLFQKRSGGEISLIRGLISGLFAVIPSFLVATLAFICNVCGISVGMFMDQGIAELFYRIWFFPFASLFSLIEQTPILYFLPVFVIPIASGLGYFLGSRKLFLRDYLYYQREKTEC